MQRPQRRLVIGAETCQRPRVAELDALGAHFGRVQFGQRIAHRAGGAGNLVEGGEGGRPAVARAVSGQDAVATRVVGVARRELGQHLRLQRGPVGLRREERDRLVGESELEAQLLVVAVARTLVVARDRRKAVAVGARGEIAQRVVGIAGLVAQLVHHLRDLAVRVEAVDHALRVADGVELRLRAGHAVGRVEAVGGAPGDEFGCIRRGPCVAQRIDHAGAAADEFTRAVGLVGQVAVGRDHGASELKVVVERRDPAQRVGHRLQDVGVALVEGRDEVRLVVPVEALVGKRQVALFPVLRHAIHCLLERQRDADEHAVGVVAVAGDVAHAVGHRSELALRVAKAHQRDHAGVGSAGLGDALELRARLHEGDGVAAVVLHRAQLATLVGEAHRHAIGVGDRQQRALSVKAVLALVFAHHQVSRAGGATATELGQDFVGAAAVGGDPAVASGVEVEVQHRLVAVGHGEVALRLAAGQEVVVRFELDGDAVAPAVKRARDDAARVVAAHQVEVRPKAGQEGVALLVDQVAVGDVD